MKYLISLLLSLTLFSTSYAQIDELGIPAEVKPIAGYARLKPTTDASWIIYRGIDNANPLPSEFLGDPRWFLLDTSRLPVGRYRFWVVGNVKDSPVQGEFTVVIGDAPPVVVPPVVPPKPDVPPTPVPTPIEVGSRVVMLFRESADKSVAMADLIEDLRTRDASKYLKEKGHSFYIFDPNDTTSSVNSWRPRFNGMKPPFVIVTKPDGKGKAEFVGSEELGENQSANKVLEILNKFGG